MTAKYVHQAWQKEWDEAVVVSYKFDEILSKLSDKLSPVCKTEKEDTALNRLYDYWLFLLHAFLPFEKKSLLFVLHVKHILMECVDLVETRKRCYEKRSLISLLQNAISGENF